MKIYLPGSRGNHNMFVQPGKEHPNSDFLDPAGEPLLIKIEFKAGVAKVADNLGRYVLDKGLAQSHPLLLPDGFAVV